MGKNLDDLQKRWESFTIIQPDPWKRIDGQRLMFTRSGYGLREDGEGKLIGITEADFVVGRDEKRVLNVVKAESRNQSQSLFRLMLVPRKSVVGATRIFQTKPVAKKECMLRVLDGVIHMPERLFICFHTEAGSYSFRKIIKEL